MSSLKWVGSEKVNDNLQTGHRKSLFKFSGLHGCKQDRDQMKVTERCHIFDCYIMNMRQTLAIDLCTGLGEMLCIPGQYVNREIHDSSDGRIWGLCNS